jgi:Leucine-rich repeat (LRR) protein
MNLLNTLLIFCFALCFGATALNAQNVNIPDVNFKTYLVGNTAINTNGDTEIQVTEAVAFSGTIYCPNLSIADLTGIEAFVNLTTLFCYSNQLSSLDVTQNTSLTSLHCSSNQLSSLDVTQNTSLTELYCYSNQLSSLDVTQNTSLTWLSCGDNQLSSLDVTQNTSLTSLSCGDNQLSSLDVTQNTSLTELVCYSNQLSSLDVTQNTSLTWLSCGDNQLSSLDVTQNTSLTELECNDNQLSSLDFKNGNNSNINNFNATGNPNLSCIQVDDSTYSTANWSSIDATATFRTDCSLFSSISSINKEINLTVYPNPTTKNITLDFGKIYKEANIQVSNLTGQTVLSQQLENVSNTTLELEGAAGIYFVNIQTEEGSRILKVIKE